MMEHNMKTSSSYLYIFLGGTLFILLSLLGNGAAAAVTSWNAGTKLLHRSKRSTPISPVDQDSIVTTHNDLKRLVGAANMYELVGLHIAK